MRSSIVYRLLGAFLLVIGIGALVIYFYTSQATQTAFNIYTTRSGAMMASHLAQNLADYYTQNSSWEGIDSVLSSYFPVQMMQGMMGNDDSTQGQGHGNGQGYGQQAYLSVSTDKRIILADGHGLVVSDTLGKLVGSQLTASELESGNEVIVNGYSVGTVLVTSNNTDIEDLLSSEFFSRVNRAIITSVLIAGVFGLLLGGTLFFQITYPLRLLIKAASKIATGDLNTRVDIHTQDEFEELGKSFNTMAESLEKAETQRLHLVADVAHELRNPLTAIRGTLEGIQDGVLPVDDEQISALYAETMLLNRLVGDLKELSLADAGQLKLLYGDIQPEQLVHQVIERVKSQADQKGIRLEMDLQPNLPTVQIDSDRITQVLINLINNSIRYTQEGGKITVQGSYNPSSESLDISVTDTGQGIPGEALPYIFNRFYRADKSRSRQSGGSGLGLAIAKQFVEAHGGVISAISPVFHSGDDAGKGTQITFSLPAVNKK